MGLHNSSFIVLGENLSVFLSWPEIVGTKIGAMSFSAVCRQKKMHFYLLSIAPVQCYNALGIVFGGNACGLHFCKDLPFCRRNSPCSLLLLVWPVFNIPVEGRKLNRTNFCTHKKLYPKMFLEYALIMLETYLVWRDSIYCIPKFVSDWTASNWIHGRECVAKF